MPQRDVMVLGELEIRRRERMVLAKGVPVSLTPGEYEIVEVMAEHPGWVFSADQLCNDTDEVDHSPDSVSVLVSRVRHKLGDAGVSDIVETVRGFGYRLSSTTSDPEDVGDVDHVSRTLRDSAWRLAEAVFDVDRSGTAEQKSQAARALDDTRRTLYGGLAKAPDERSERSE